jgi:uncharacterized protein YhbP (UPF0306 family)
VDTWQQIRGLQLRGMVMPIPEGEEWQRGWACYLKKFPFAAGLGDALARSRLYVFRPHWIRKIDNRRAFGYTEEWTPE